MAITAPTPDTDPADEPITDLVTFDEASALFKPTGHPVAARTLLRQATKQGVRIVRQGRANAASWSDLLEVHASMFPPPVPGGP